MLDVNVTVQRGAFRLEAAFTAPTPGVTALFGRSGCGKTTLVNLIAGLVADGTGRIALDGECWLDSARGQRTAAEHRRIGYVFQDSRLFPHYSVRGNLLYGAASQLPPGYFDDVLALLGLEPLLQRRPGGLSGGERQRVALGRALLRQPRLLLLDEPLASFDQSRREEVLPFLERLRDHYAIPMIFVSHQFDEVLRLATHLVVLDQGRVAAAGDIGAVSLAPALRGIIGPESVGAVVDGIVTAVDKEGDLASVTIGGEVLHVPSRQLAQGQAARLQLLARDLILAVEEPRGLSVRNQLRGRVRSIAPDGSGDLVTLDVGNVTLLSRITSAATRELQLVPGAAVWVLVKAVSVSHHAIGTAPAPGA
jgi:molybdate transport system ATP-binding protein